MSAATRLLTVDALPYELAADIIRDGKPRDVINQRIQVNDAVRVWTAALGWASTRQFYVKHILPVWLPARRYVMYRYLLVPLQEADTETEDIVYIGSDDLQITQSTVIYLTMGTVLAIRKGAALEKISVVVSDYEVARYRREDAGVLLLNSGS